MKEKKLHYAFIVAIGLFILMFPAGMVMGTASIFYAPVTKELGITMAQMGMNMTILMVVLAVAMPLISKLFNKYDTRIILTASVILNALSFVLRASTGSLWVFYFTSVLQAFAFAPLINLSIPLLANNWFANKPGTVIGICALAQGLAGTIFCSIGGLIIQNAGWRACYWVWAAITLIMGLPVTLFVIRKFPKDKGLLPFGYKATDGDGNPTTAKVSGLDLKKAIKTPAFWMIGIAVGLFTFANQYSQYMNAYVQTLGATAAVAGLVSSALQFGNMTAKVVLGPICDKGGKLGAIVSGLLGTIALVGIVLFGGSNTTVIAVLVFLYGFPYAAPNLVFPILTREVFGARELSKIWPNMVIFLSLFGAFGATVWGVLIDKLGNYQTGMYFDAAIYIIVIAFAVGASAIGKKIKNQWTEGEGQ